MKRILGVILLALAIAGSVRYVENMSAEAARRPTGNAAYEAGYKTGRATVGAAIGGIGLLGLWCLFSRGNSRPAPYSTPFRTPAVPVRPPPGDASLRGGQDTFASNPALLKLNIGHWLAANPWVIIVSASLTFVGAVVILLKPPAGIVLMITAGILVFREVRDARRKFHMGDVCPGVVVSTRDNLVAVFTDLVAASSVPRPVIKILKQPLQRIGPEPAYDGMRVAAVAHYAGDVRHPAWRNFFPEVIHCVVRDPQEIERVLGSITDTEWEALDRGIAQLPAAKPGLYYLTRSAAQSSAGPTALFPEDNWTPRKPWFATTFGIVALSVLGALVGIVLIAGLAGTVLNRMNHSPAGQLRPHRSTVPTPPHLPPVAVRPWEPAPAGPYAVGAKVEALWAGRWVPGQLTSINPGGFTVMVQLQDSRFPRPIVLSTNQVRLK